ncbi:ABC transporter permease [Mycobacterium sp. E796]|uniref:ABC transporter permease n=1 Tax=Mycobacterium sp. E796 TaxID=1834151 RepID=UPI0007FFB390|nr:ABC transporter permease [Mycobacterium sp. E796]
MIDGCVGAWRRLGRQTRFYARTLAATGDACTRYRTEIARLVAQMSLGTGVLAIIGGTIVIVGFLTLSTGAIIAVQGYNSLAGIGVEALTGFVSAYLNVRAIAPTTAGIGLAATIGAGATAQLGAMRISEEIDALEAMGVRSIAYLGSTRVISGVVVIIPLYCVGLLTSFFAARFGTTFGYGQSTGVYDHYFNTFLNPLDVLWSFVEVVAMGAIIMLIHTYYGFTASGGPAGVGEAVGRAVRTSLVCAVFITLLVSLAAYGHSGNLDLSG